MVTGDPLVEYRGHDSFVFCVDQYCHMIASGSFDETVKLWDVSTTWIYPFCIFALYYTQLTDRRRPFIVLFFTHF